MSLPLDFFDLRLIEWDGHPLLRAVQKKSWSSFKKFLATERGNSFGVDSYNYARTDSGKTPLMLTFALNLNPETRRNTVFTLMKLFHLDPNMPDGNGRTAIFHAIFHNAPVDIVDFLIKNGADLEMKDSYQLTPLIYAVGSGRSDLVKLICPDYSAKLREALKNKFGNWDNLSGKLRSPRKDLLEIPFPTEGSPKRGFQSADYSPVLGTPVNGIRFRLSPSSPSNSSSSPLSTVSTGNHPTTRRTSLDKPNGLLRIAERKVMRRVCSAVFDSRLWDKAWGAMQFAQLTQNLGIYLEEADYYLDKSPEPRDDKEDEVGGIEEAEKEPRRVSIHGVPVSSPILIKSRSVEDSINVQHGTPPQFRVMPRGDRSWRKNALASGHLIERQGSAPQLQLKRRPRPSSETSSATGGSPTGSLSRTTTRPQITVSPLVNSKLATQEQK